MKDITKYLMDITKSTESTTISTNGSARTELQKAPSKKRNRVKIKISRTDTEERVCDIIESNCDMIDKTPSPFTTVSSVQQVLHNDTPKRSSSRLALNRNHSTLPHQDTNGDYISQKSNRKAKYKVREDNGNSKEKDRYSKKSSDKTCTSNDISLSSLWNEEENIIVIEVSDSESDNEDCSQREESNAFQILMNRSKATQYLSPTKLSPQDENLHTKVSEEYKEKLKRSKEKLMALADKKGYSKRKLAELEEEGKLERIIQNRIKFFKGEKKKDNEISAIFTNQKQSSSSLLNYFSKTPLEVGDKSMAEMSTFVVKADVHMPEDSVTHSGCTANSSQETRTMKGQRNSYVKFSSTDDIKIIHSENINLCQSQQELYTQTQFHKRRWSLRIKLQTQEHENSIPGDSSDEELFLPRSKVKLNSKEISKHTNTDETNSLNKNKKAAKQLNEHTKLAKKENGQLESLENKQNCVSQETDNIRRLSRKSYNEKIVNNGTSNLTQTDKCKSVAVHSKGLKQCTDINSKINRQTELRDENCSVMGSNISKRKSNEKLAPLFTKRRKPDPEAIAARRLFLQPDIAENDCKNSDKKVNVYNVLPFPIISHITQLNNLSCGGSNNFDIRTKNNFQYVPVLDINNYKCVTDYTETKLKPVKSISKPNIQEVLTELEKQCSDTRKMWNSISLIVKGDCSKISSPKSRNKKVKLLKRKEIIGERQKENENENSVWTYKYKPLCTQEVVGNEEAAAKLREWLDGWRVPLTNDDVSSGDEFYSSDCSHSNNSESNQVAVLLGPHGSGKSASVYAVAEELGYTVLEVNASSRRTGKKLLKQLEEATKSHRIRKDKGTSVFFKGSVSDETLPKKIPQNSLILLEDIDLVFDEDEGFISATSQLVSNTKRPIVMTCRDVCPHLSKMAPQQNRIYFQRAFGYKVSTLFELISLAETGYRISHNCIAELLQSGDLRRALLQLQYLLVSGPPQVSEQSVHVRNSLWQNLRYFLYKPAIKACKKRKTKNNANSDTTNSMDVLNNVADQLDTTAFLSSLIDVEDPVLNISCIKILPSLSLVEDATSYSASHSVSSEIADWIGKKIICKDQSSEHDVLQSQNRIAMKKQLHKGVDLALSHATSLLLDQRSMSVDYLPSVRTICRAEECRASISNKRGNRFFHYLHGLKIPTTSLKPNILAAACQIMRDKADNSM